MSAKTVGFDRELKLKWLDATADLLLEGLTGKDILARLNAILDGELSDGGTRGAKGKTITVLLHIWVKVPDIAKPRMLEESGRLELCHHGLDEVISLPRIFS